MHQAPHCHCRSLNMLGKKPKKKPRLPAAKAADSPLMEQGISAAAGAGAGADAGAGAGAADVVMLLVMAGCPSILVCVR